MSTVPSAPDPPEPLRSPVPEPVPPTPEQENGAVAQFPCAPGKLVYVRLPAFEIVVPEVVPAEIVAATVTSTVSPGSRQEIFAVTVCITMELPVVKDVPPAQVSTPEVPCELVMVTVPRVRLALKVSVRTISNAVAALLPLATLLNESVYVSASPGRYGPAAGETDFVIDVIAGSVIATVTFGDVEPTCEPLTRSVTSFGRKFPLDTPEEPGLLSKPWLISIPELTFNTNALNSTTTNSESASASELVMLPTLNVTSVPLPNGPALIAAPGTTKVGETALLDPLTTNPAPANVDEVIQPAPPLQTNATVAVPSFRNCKPVGKPSNN